MFYFIMGTRNLHGFLFFCLFSLIIGLLGDRVFLETVLMGKGNIKHVIEYYLHLFNVVCIKKKHNVQLGF